MKINLAKSAGFCFGVKRALEIAFDTAKSTHSTHPGLKPGACSPARGFRREAAGRAGLILSPARGGANVSNSKVYMLGDIVHNEDVVMQIRKAGIRKIENLSDGKNKTLLIRAHGASIKTIEKAKNLGFNIIDATCPMVKEIHKIVIHKEQSGYKIIVIGDKKHEEVQGIIGQLKGKAIVIDKLERLPFKQLKRITKAAIVVQSTQNLEKVLKIVGALKAYIKELKFFNTICKPTRIKQGEIRSMPLNNDVMIIIGSKNSANTKRLYEISKSLNKNSYWVQSKRDLKSGWLEYAKKVGISTGASTPDSTTQDIIKYIKKINRNTSSLAIGV